MEELENNIKIVPIKGHFSNEEVAAATGVKTKKPELPHFGMRPYKPIRIVKHPNGMRMKSAYGQFFPEKCLDLDIELLMCRRLERYLGNAREKDKQAKFKFHFKNVISLLDPECVEGWNEWSENIIDLILCGKLHRVLWGSGNCGKSKIIADALYAKWRINPHGRQVVLAAKVVKDASSRVWGYIKTIHQKAPKSAGVDIDIIDNNQVSGIFSYIINEDGKRVRDERHCIITLPVKVDVKGDELGSNLLGKHPDDLLIIAFDECQELPGLMIDMPIFINWYTNCNPEVWVWGNPRSVSYHQKEDYDLLFRLGAGHVNLKTLKTWAKDADKTFVKTTKDTMLLHFSMLDSPKDHESEKHFKTLHQGVWKERLHFLAGKANVERIRNKTEVNSPGWFSQVLGFPYLKEEGDENEYFLSPYMAKEINKYPLRWKRNDFEDFKYFMGVDPSTTGYGDKSIITVMRMGTMDDARDGLDPMHGKHCVDVRPVEGEEFVDTTIRTMWEISQQLRIPLKHICIETHGTPYEYAMKTALSEKGYWASSVARGENYITFNPTAGASEVDYLFTTVGNMHICREICRNSVTENWLSVRCAFMTKQIFNVPDTYLQQGYSRRMLWNASRKIVSAEEKKVMFKRGLKSPDYMDSLANCVLAARRNGFQLRALKKGGYDSRYGDEYMQKKNNALAAKRMSAITQLLGVSSPHDEANKVSLKNLVDGACV